ncbi:MAG: hypothetical protein ACFFCP_04085 [Promethearchaeota archaeon]
MTENTQQTSTPRLFDASHLRSYAIFTIGIAGIIVLYHALSGGLIGMPGRSPFPQGPRGIQQFFGGPPNGPGLMSEIWPLWGQLVVPSVEGLVIGLISIGLLAVALLVLKKRQYDLPSLTILVILGLALLFLTNLVQGWSTGIEDTIGGISEIYWDLSKVVDPLSFISNFNSLQVNLSLHAQTQPPGAVLTIYFLNLLFQSPALTAIGLSVITGVLSAFFINRVYAQIFGGETAKYGAFLYLLLPAVQVYYLANIYAVVATLAAGTLFFYFHPNRAVSLVGTLVTLFLGTFISFLFVYMPLMLFLFELSMAWSSVPGQSHSSRLGVLASSLGKLVAACIGVVLLYGLLYLGLGFNYVEAFLYASSLENPNGFMLLASPTQYIATRSQDILDIVVFFGPVLAVLCYRGLKMMKEASSSRAGGLKSYSLVLSSLVALLLLFLTGAPKKGETARICMFVLPFLLIPVLYYLDGAQFSRSEKIKLLLVVFLQAVIIQLFGQWLW